jgi:ADP-heptose:LPS heptosyltransferase
MNINSNLENRLLIAGIQPNPLSHKNRNIILSFYKGLGDEVLLTGVVKEIKTFYPHFNVYVMSYYPDLWKHNPYITILDPTNPQIEIYSVQQIIFPKEHTLMAIIRKIIERYIRTPIPRLLSKGEIYLSEDEKKHKPFLSFIDYNKPVFILNIEGSSLWKSKWWIPEYAQKVINHFQNKIQFVQIGSSTFYHTHLNNCVDLIGKTTIRDIIHLLYHSNGVLCNTGGIMHLYASLPLNAPCIVIAGGRETPKYIAYPEHVFLHTIGKMDCCKLEGCWLGYKSCKNKTTLYNKEVPVCMAKYMTPDIIINEIEKRLN